MAIDLPHQPARCDRPGRPRGLAGPREPHSGGQAPRPVPLLGLSAGLVAIVSALLEGGTYDWAPWVWLCLAAGVAAVVAVVLAEDRTPDSRAMALIPFGLVRERTSAVALVIQLVAFGGFSGFLLVFMLWLQDGQGYSPLDAGLVTIAFCAGGLAMTAFVGRLTVRFGRLVVGAGALTAAVGTLAITVPSSSVTTSISPWVVVPGLFIVGIGMNLVMPTLTTIFLSAVPPRYAGSASGVWTTSQQFGGAIGTAGLSVVFFTASGHSGHNNGLGASTLAITTALVATALLCFALPKPEIEPSA
ncbi:MAG: MFS transporter [Streptosporangiales bacterium]|nr:MFS transporter [Streptosporangiales bacterium]